MIPARVMKNMQTQIHSLGDLDPVIFSNSRSPSSISIVLFFLFKIQPTNSKMDTTKETTSDRNVFKSLKKSMSSGLTAIPSPTYRFLSYLIEL
jgi:hypothetical protein